ncbi:DNA internalization-related competence protein ComEC/Rec2 [Clostridiaceae bacterium M8S5]|nr:DNA internalization-related competence protein ComEC/Rec2 [Clostridiaceae bacterium M8S5]
MKKPFAMLTIFFILGLLAGFFIDIDLYIVIILSCILVFITVYIHNNITFLILVTLLGMIVIQLNLHKSEMTNFNGDMVIIRGIISDKISQNEYSTNYIVKTEYIKNKEEFLKVSEKIILKCIGNNELKIGDYVEYKSKVSLPSTNTNPKLFDYRLYLMMDDIFTMTKCKAVDIQIIERSRLSTIPKFIIDVKEKLKKSMDISLSPECSQIAKAIIFSDKTALSEKDSKTIRSIGMAHIIAVSGFHVWILSAIILYLLKLFIYQKRIRVIVCLILLWLYGGLIGYPPSVLRALIMLSCGMFADVIYRKNDSINSLCFAAFLILMFKPLWIFSVGFQLSFTAAISLLLLTPVIKKVVPNSSISAIIAVQLGILPVIAYHFNQVPIFAIIVNFIALPLISLIIVILFIMMIVSLISIKICSAIGILCGGLILSFRYMSILLYKILGLNMILPSLTTAEIIVYYMGIFMLFGYIKLKDLSREIKRVIFVYAVLVVLCIGLTDMLYNDYKIEFIDIGQGDCMHLELGNKNYLIDSGGILYGSFSAGEKVVVPYLLKSGITHLDGIFISHFDTDHCAGVPYILDNLSVDKLYISYIDYNNKLSKEIIIKAKESDVDIGILKKGDKLSIDSNSNIEIIYPKSNNEKGLSANDKSIVMLMKIFNTKILFTGDIELESESKIINDIEDIDILKVAHHGSKTSSSAKFLEKSKPEYGIISVGTNVYGHPHKSVIDRLGMYNTKVFRTDTDGLITVSITKDDYNITSYNMNKNSLIGLFKVFKMIIWNTIFVCILSLLIKKKSFVNLISLNELKMIIN